MINSVALTGRLTKDVDLRTAQNGISVARFTLAVNRQYSKDKEADFINCVAFKKTAEVLQQFAGKGRLIGVTGSIQTRHYTGKDGKEVYVTEVLADNVSFLDSRNGSQNEYNGQQGGYSQQQGNQPQYGQQAPQGQNFSQQGGNLNQSWPQGEVNVSNEDLPF
ncbi:single-stranded DNA-binding protein [Lactobacillus delbrueckii subsp. lactis]|uniref:single-stranded DNA-binding protein n=1 Tax=Lactobacillus delbrueckii TaxID=1584 RepID=UPI001E2BBA48|nr:single-stranded DNA-binding protein [Lactobacillus delbrueckii]MCD5528929.1 single-stranded DNA-binding protein [Lactobacillus delbrueckii subsp. lactis]MCS8607329.1 single-stranded DNA-binding protein [Lactobacillus delbrueckii subsp. lactis]